MGITRNVRKHRTLVATMILVGASCLGLSFCGALSSSPNAFSISESHTDVNVNLVNGVAIRILNSAATAEITELNLSATAAPTGTFVTDNFKVEVSTANKTGYKLYMNSSYQNPSTSTYTTDLVNQTNTSYTIPTVAADTTKSALSTAAPGTTNANKWAYSLDDTTYSPVPANSVQTQIGSHDTPTAGTKTPVYIGMNVNVEKPSGVYKNQLTFSAVGNPVPIGYTLAYDANGGSGAPASQTSTTTASSVTFAISSTKPTRTNYVFRGWSESATSETGSGSGPNGLYIGGDTITVNAEGWEVTKTLYAAYSALPAFWTISTMQEMTADVCNSVYTPSAVTGTSALIVDKDSALDGGYMNASAGSAYVAQHTLRDVRDNNTYTVAKLTDGNCWMTSNLKLNLVLNQPVTASKNNGTTFSFTPTRCNNYCPLDDSTVLQEKVTNGGYYYNWYAATAGVGQPRTYGDVDGSICPKGWKLPYFHTVSANKSYAGMTNAYGITVNSQNITSGFDNATFTGAPFFFTLNGVAYEDGGVGYYGSIGFYFTSSAINDSGIPNYMNFGFGSLNIAYTDYRGLSQGMAVRCVNI